MKDVVLALDDICLNIGFCLICGTFTSGLYCMFMRRVLLTTFQRYQRGQDRLDQIIDCFCEGVKIR